MSKLKLASVCSRVAMAGPYNNTAYGPTVCPWGGPIEGDDKDYFFLTRGEEWRLFFDSKWGDADWQDWHWKEQAAIEEDQRRSHVLGRGLQQTIPKRVVLVARAKIRPLPKKTPRKICRKR